MAGQLGLIKIYDDSMHCRYVREVSRGTGSAVPNVLPDDQIQKGHLLNALESELLRTFDQLTDKKWGSHCLGVHVHVEIKHQNSSTG